MPSISPTSLRSLRAIGLTILLLAAASAAAAQTADDPFAKGAWTLQLAGHAAIETWNYNVSHEDLWGVVPGFTYGLGKGVVFAATVPLYFVSQRGNDAWLVGGTFGFRGRIYRRARTSLFWEFDVGLSQADTYTPPGGTRFNYLALGGAGATVRLRPGTHLAATMRWIHVSNNGLAGRHRNPDIEAVGPQIGVLIAF
jgi:lipid A 3-O-deacylase PagL